MPSWSSDHEIVHHRTVGPVELKIVVLTAAVGSADEARLHLALLTGVSEPAVGRTGPRPTGRRPTSSP
ncbi:hypothetical protein RHODO2019_16090 [Rhodococcus antarcticus]|uniref:Uncharacterized protein n=1 Tax=Rhodococcus antarcticus TaxID=2987751 RepID=A0ABY6NZ10_9NOCA|nr:hypothetical protein [Rhodococcus antarcticus]UZJ24622.1 hypothetical protein RHODO2019_16090 [Rhodococcus antarcticus]